MFGTNVDDVHVKVCVFTVDHEDENGNLIYASFASSKAHFQRNAIEKIKVDGHPFIIKVDYPQVDVLYDNSEQELLASLNIEGEKESEISDTTINCLGYTLSVTVTQDIFYEETEEC